MGSGHSHSAAPPPPADPRVRRLLAIALAPFAVAVLVGLVALWPHERVQATSVAGPPQDLIDATVVRTELRPCARLGGAEPAGGALDPGAAGFAGPQGDCSIVTIRPTSGPEEGDEVVLPDFALSAGAPDLRVGDTVVVGRSVSPLDLQVQYYFSDVERSRSLWLLAAVFAVVVVGIARWRGVSALVGLVFTYAVLVVFTLPALLAGSSPLLVALVSSGLIMFVVLYLAHGVNVRTTTALLGTLVSLALTGLLAALFVELTRLSGASSEEATYVKAQVGDVDLKGLLLAGIIIGALGVLNDVTVTQSSAAFEIHAANPDRGARAVYRSAMRVGRDHIASVVDTLVLAYAGASLPLLILFMLAEQPLARILSSTIVAEEIVRTLVGSIGLVASVPVTTALAATVAARIAGGPGVDPADHGPDADDHDHADHDHADHDHADHDHADHDHADHDHADHDHADHDGGPGDHLDDGRREGRAAWDDEVIAGDRPGTPATPAAEAPAGPTGGGRRARSRRRSAGSGDGWQPPRAEREFREP